MRCSVIGQNMQCQENEDLICLKRQFWIKELRREESTYAWHFQINWSKSSLSPGASFNSASFLWTWERKIVELIFGSHMGREEKQFHQNLTWLWLKIQDSIEKISTEGSKLANILLIYCLIGSLLHFSIFTWWQLQHWPKK